MSFQQFITAGKVEMMGYSTPASQVDTMNKTKLHS